jgi:hypothetical protein
MRNRSTLSSVAVLLLLLAACHGDSNKAPDPGSSAQSKTAAPVQRGPTPEALTAGMVEAVTVGKSSVPVDVKFDLTARPEVGQKLDIVIALMPKVAGSAAIQAAGSDGLQLAPGIGKFDLAAVEPTKAYRVTVAATPSAEGVQFLGLDVFLTHDATTEKRSFAVPVIVTTRDGDAPATVH